MNIWNMGNDNNIYQSTPRKVKCKTFLLLITFNLTIRWLTLPHLLNFLIENYPNFYRTGGSDIVMVAPIIALLKKYKWKTVATIHQTDPLFATVSGTPFTLSLKQYWPFNLEERKKPQTHKTYFLGADCWEYQHPRPIWISLPSYDFMVYR